MDFNRIQPLIGRLAVLSIAGAGAQLAWRAEYMASFALCLGLAIWAVARIISDGLDQRGQHTEAQARAWSALLERESEARRLTAFLDHAPVPLLAMRSRSRTADQASPSTRPALSRRARAAPTMRPSAQPPRPRHSARLAI